MLVTDDTSQYPMSALNADAELNIPDMLVTDDTSQLPMSTPEQTANMRCQHNRKQSAEPQQPADRLDRVDHGQDESSRGCGDDYVVS